jgi:hypothetical protein
VIHVRIQPRRDQVALLLGIVLALALAWKVRQPPGAGAHRRL